MNNTLKIVNFLGKNLHKAFTMHELSKLVSIPYATFYRTVQEMKDLLIIEQVGKSKTLKLNFNNPVVKSYLAIASEEEKKRYLQKQPVINKIANELKTNEIVLLFGSYAKKTQTSRSDIDLLIINKNGRKSLSFSKYETLFKKKINPLFITKKEFKQMLKSEEENVGKQALKNHIVLNNSEQFWECVLNNI